MSSNANSRLTLLCPVTQQRTIVPFFPDSPPGKPVALLPDEDGFLPFHPTGWGSLEIRVVAENPEVAECNRQREEVKKAMLEQVQAALAGTDLNKLERRKLEAGMADGSAEKEIEHGAALQVPMPEAKVVTLRIAFPVLGPEAIPQLFSLLKDHGYPIQLDGV